MITLTFEIDEVDAERLRRVAAARGVASTEVMREALRRELARSSEPEGILQDDQDPRSRRRDLDVIADRGPVEDWSDWADAEG